MSKGLSRAEESEDALDYAMASGGLIDFRSSGIPSVPIEIFDRKISYSGQTELNHAETALLEDIERATLIRRSRITRI